jgi:putative acetyltransferase
MNRATPITFYPDDLDSLDVQYLVEFHYAELRSISPPDACHVLLAIGLRDPAVTVWSARDVGRWWPSPRSRSSRTIMGK